MVSTKCVFDLLTSPGKIAHKLNWRKQSGANLLSLTVSKSEIDVVVASHPGLKAPVVEQLPPIPLRTVAKATTKANRRVLAPSVSEQLAEVVDEYNVCGFIIFWPVQKEGWCGAPCGRVLHVLDQVLSNPNIPDVVSTGRPVCLYDLNRHLPTLDEWGRSPVFGRQFQLPSSDYYHAASVEQYEHSTNVRAIDIWNDFVAHQWPDHNIIVGGHHHHQTERTTTTWRKNPVRIISTSSSSSVSVIPPIIDDRDDDVPQANFA